MYHIFLIQIIFQLNPTEGYVSHIDALGIGLCAMKLGAGRKTKEDTIDPSVGIVLNKKLGDKVLKDEPLAYLYANGPVNEIKDEVIKAYTISDTPSNDALILKIIR